MFYFHLTNEVHLFSCSYLMIFIFCEPKSCESTIPFAVEVNQEALPHSVDLFGGMLHTNICSYD